MRRARGADPRAADRPGHVRLSAGRGAEEDRPGAGQAVQRSGRRGRASTRSSPPCRAASTWCASAWARPATSAAASRCWPALKDLLRIEVGETSSDRLFSLDVGRCFGACGLAPVIMIDDDVHQRVKPARLAKILDQYREPDATPATATATERAKNDPDDRQREGTDRPARRPASEKRRRSRPTATSRSASAWAPVASPPAR